VDTEGSGLTVRAAGSAQNRPNRKQRQPL